MHMVDTEGQGQVVSVESNDGFTIDSNRVSHSELSEAFEVEAQEDTPDTPKKKRSAAASELGKAGGKAAAKARKEKAAEAEKAETDGPKFETDDAEPAQEAKPAQEETEKAPAEAEEKPEAKPEAEAEEAETEASKEKPLGKPRDDPRARMLEATRKESEAKRERDAAIAKAAALEERLARLERGPEPDSEEAQAGPAQKPKLDDYPDGESYLDARDEWNRAQWVKELEERNQVQAVDRQYVEVVQRYADAVKDSAEQWSDDVKELQAEFQLEEGQKPTARNWIANELVFSPESAPSLALYLSEHPDVFQRIAALSTPRDVSREMAKLEARLEAATPGTSPKREEVSKAPPPIKPVSGEPFVADGDLSADMPFHAYFEKANKKFGKYPQR